MLAPSYAQVRQPEVRAVASAEQQLVALAQRGDADAFGRLYDMHAERIYHYVFTRVTERSTAEDLTSQVFLKAWEHLVDYRPGSTPFIGWVYTIAHNTVIDHYRMQRPTCSLDDIVEVSAREPGPVELSEQRYEDEELQQAIDSLTPLQRDVITMRLQRGMDTLEIAEQLHRTPGAVRALQMRALETLVGALQIA